MRNSSRQIFAPLGMSYVPWHEWEDMFDPENALMRGTAFPLLEMPFCPKGAYRG